MANTTITQFPAGQSRYRINFDYLARSFVVVTLIDSDNASNNKVLTVGNDYRFLDATNIEVIASQTGFDLLQIHRFTSTELLVSFRDGSVLTASNLTTSELQAIHIAEEGRDQTTGLAKQYADQSVAASKEAKRYLDKILELGISGYTPVGSFEDGGTINTGNEVLRYGSGTATTHYRWDGTIPDGGKVVLPGSTPASTGGIAKGAWVDVTDATLRSDLSSDRGTTLVMDKSPLAYAVTRGARDKFAEAVSVLDFGAVGDGVTDDTLAIQHAIDSGTRASEQLPSLSVPIHSILVPRGKFAVTSLLVGRRCNIFFEGGSLQPLDASATQDYLIKFAEGYNKVFNIRIDMKYAINYGTAIWCRGRYMDFICPEIWAYHCAWWFGDPAWKDDASKGALGDSEIQIIGGWCNWGITHHRAFGINTIVQMIGHEAYSFKWSLPDGDPRKAAWESLPEITGYNCGALIYMTGSFTGNYSGQQPNFLSQIQVTNDPSLKNTYGRYVLSGTHCETGNLFQCDAHGAIPVQDFSTQMLTATNCTGYVSGGNAGYFINGLDAGQGISVNGCSFYGINMKQRAVYALNAKVHVSNDSFPDLTSGNVLEDIQARFLVGYENYMPLRVGVSAQTLGPTLQPLKLTSMLASDMDINFASTYYDSATGTFTIPNKLRNASIEVILSPSGGLFSDYADIALYINNSLSQILSTGGSIPRVTFNVRTLKTSDTVQIRVAHYQSRTLDATANNRITISGAS